MHSHSHSSSHSIACSTTTTNGHAHDHDGMHSLDSSKNMEMFATLLESPERDKSEKPMEIIQLLDLKNKVVMDIGAGTGYFTLKFAELAARVIAADVSDEFQIFLKKRTMETNKTNIELRKVTHTDPMLKDGEVDVVFIANTYHHLENEERVQYLKKIKKGLKKSGEVIVLDYFKVVFSEPIIAPPMEMRLSIDQVVFELKQAGFNNIQTNVSLLSFHYIIRATIT